MTIPKKYRGFTLMELTIVVSILAILALIILLGLNPMSQINKGFDSRRRNDLHKLKIAFEDYYADHDCYPPKTVLEQCGSAILKPYLSVIPCDPNDGSPYDMKIIPDNSVCPQQYAIYAPILSFYDKDVNEIPGCPQTLAVSSPNMTSKDLAVGCGAPELCYYLYGCVNGACVQVGEANQAACGPTWCYPDCSGNNCSNPVNFCVAK